MTEQSDRQATDAFEQLQRGWLMQLDDGWWAYFNDEPPIGPFAGKADAARAGLKAWGKG